MSAPPPMPVMVSVALALAMVVVVGAAVGALAFLVYELLSTVARALAGLA